MLIGVGEKTLRWWEGDEKPPFVHEYPAIIRYLDYEPWAKPQSLGEALLAERRRRGQSIDRAAGEIGVDQGTFRRWERGEWKPTRSTLGALASWVGFDPREAFPNDVR